MSIIFPKRNAPSKNRQEGDSPGAVDRDANQIDPSRSLCSDPSGETARSKIHRAYGVVGSATLLSRVLGAARDIVIASVFGAGLVSDAFVAAFRIPNLLRRMFGEGSLSIVFVPVYTDCLLRQGRLEADRLVNSAIRCLALVLTLIVLLLIIAAPWVVRVMAPGFAADPEKFMLTVNLTRIMLPYVISIGLVALSMGILNVLGHFAAPALAPVFLNISMITAISAGAFFSGSKVVLVKWLASGVLAGGVLQLILQIPFLIRNKIYFWRPSRFWHPAIFEMAKMMGPVLFGAAVYQINSLVITLLASLLPQGSVSCLYYADRLVQFPLGIFGVAAATVVLPTMARQSTEQQFEALRRTFAHAIQLVSFITLPAMVGLIVLREPIVALLFKRGAFDQHTTQLTASALLYYGIGLWGFSAVRVVLNVFYALKDTRTPVRMAVWAVAANVMLGVVLMRPMGHNGLALALSLSSMLNLGLLIVALRRRLGALGWRRISLSVMKSALCALFMGISIWALARWLGAAEIKRSIVLLPVVAGCVITGVLVYIGFARMVGVPEIQLVVDLVRKKKKQHGASA
ncbi:MAG: murein biosynthesis integral membrane protein MurJ [Desulfobacteraceae bacterium]|nr:murein biosynthesis integral membrane protein MurJ [Desulfobacteraceae bacterium]